MRSFLVCSLSLLVLSIASQATANEIRGLYLESRTCDVYTGPCFANGEMGTAGKEALLAWKVQEGSWKGTSLEGLTVALVLKSDNCLGDDGVFPAQPGEVKSVILVDEQGSPEQQAALVDFVKETACSYTKQIAKVESTAMTLESNYVTAESVFQAGDVAEMRTRKLGDNDCVCTNEQVFYQPLVDVHYATPAYSVSQKYAGDGLNANWSMNGSRSSFLAVFKK